MKKKCFIGCIVVLMLVFASCSNLKDSNRDESSSQPPINMTLHISPTLCEMSFDGMSPKQFVDTNGEGTFLEGKYNSAKIDEDGCLILVVNKYIITSWKSSYTHMQILQCVLGKSRDIGVIIDYSKDFLDFMKYADMCGFEISENFSTVIATPGDDLFYVPYVMPACMHMQMFEGKKCTDIKVEYFEYDVNGELVRQIIYTHDGGVEIIE